eukprot:TRINITY_DN38620_c0_g1_i1.p1 TRINITY_DN38620_c0_g1~~TRINITY_DN38620_c0_g1_i1.p1  ORF type:complete len:277 (-),score=34.38 TRINITY_DN38620_c0_g1_i1:213-977(-)
MASSCVYLITGSSRGLGLEFVRQLLARGDNVIATCRNPSGATELQALLAYHASNGARNFGICLPLDVSSEESVAALPAALDSTGKAPVVDVLVHNAGIASPNFPIDPVGTANKGVMMECFATNAVGPLLLTQALLPRLRAGSGKKIFFVSTNLASLTNADPAKGVGGVSYRASKTAMNMVARCLAGEHGPLTQDGFAITLCNPGWVDTDMGSSNGREPPLAPCDSIRGMLAVIDSMGAHSNGDFVDYTGAKNSW